jgi:hypothetical protein
LPRYAREAFDGEFYIETDSPMKMAMCATGYRAIRNLTVADFAAFSG